MSNVAREAAMMEPSVEILLVQRDQPQIDLTLEVIQSNHLANRIHVLRDGGEALDFLFRTGPYANRQPINPRLVLFHLRLAEHADVAILSRLSNDRRTSDIPITVLATSNDDRMAAMNLLREYHLALPVVVIGRPTPADTVRALSDAVGPGHVRDQEPGVAAPDGEPEATAAGTQDGADLTQLCLERDLDALLRVARGAAHEFNNVFSVIVAYTEMLLRDMDLDDPRRAGAEEIFKSIARASRLTRELLTFCPTGSRETAPSDAPDPAPRATKRTSRAGAI